MFCSKCGCELPDRARFCMECGQSLKEPMIKEKRIAIVELSIYGYFIDINSTERDIVDWCKLQYHSLGFQREGFDHHASVTEIPGRFYFHASVSSRDVYAVGHKVMTLDAIIKDRLIKERWNKDTGYMWLFAF